MNNPNEDIFLANGVALDFAKIEMKNINEKFSHTYGNDDSRTAVLFAYHLFNQTAQLLVKHVSRDYFQIIAKNMINQIDFQEALQEKIESIVFREEAE